MRTVTLYTDGACSGNPGPGGWGAILEYQGVRKEFSGGEASTTNNRMELTALNPGLWDRLLQLTHVHQMRYHWVKGHADNPMNNRCDELAVAEWKKLK